ncbi:MAG: S24/S26 family peptidase [Bacteroidales bacterium]|nr:S24/S26 family peptidase [Bacteroidales bacterium]
MEKMVINNDEFFSHVLELLEKGRQVTIPVKGYSMLPFIRGGKDLVVLEQPGPLRVDDIVLFHVGPAEGGRYIMHRILAIDGDKVDIMGDGVPYNHEHVRTGQICGKAVRILRNGMEPVDPYCARELCKVHLWQRIRPVRRYLLFIYRHLPWNRHWLEAE